jgi:TRAP-type C4-dicarboxylate transport system substrate-binding protein
VQVALAISLAIVGASCSGSEADKAGGRTEGEPIVLRLAKHDSYYAFAAFVAAVDKRSGGSIRIDVLPDWRGGEVDYERGTVEDIRKARVQLGVVGVRVWDTMGVTSFRPLVAPFLVDSLALQRRVLESPLPARMLEGVERAGVVGLAVLPGALRRPVGLSRALASPEDYRGMTIGIRPGRVARATFEALGARAKGYVPGSISDLDGVELDLATIAQNGYDQLARSLLVNVVLWPRPETIVMNRAAFEELTPEQQEILRRAGQEALAPELDRVARDEKEALSAICKRDEVSLVTASPFELVALHEAVQPVYDKLEGDPQTKEWIGEIKEMRDERLAAGPAVLHCPGRGSQREAGASALDGVWARTVSAQELRDVGASKAEANALKGSYRVEHRDGRWSEHQLPTGRTCSGTYVIDGDIMRFRVAKASPAPSDYCTPGYTSAVIWSVYRDKLTIAGIPGRPAPLPAIAKPATRVG